MPSLLRDRRMIGCFSGSICSKRDSVCLRRPVYLRRPVRLCSLVQAVDVCVGATEVPELRTDLVPSGT
jgi:hypothetical protein